MEELTAKIHGKESLVGHWHLGTCSGPCLPGCATAWKCWNKGSEVRELAWSMRHASFLFSLTAAVDMFWFVLLQAHVPNISPPLKYYGMAKASLASVPHWIVCTIWFHIGHVKLIILHSCFYLVRFPYSGCLSSLSLPPSSFDKLTWMALHYYKYNHNGLLSQADVHCAKVPNLGEANLSFTGNIGFTRQ